MRHLIIFMLCLVVLTGCSTVDVDTSVSNSVTQNDFILTIESSQSQYALKKISDVPLDIKATFTYTGDQEELPIWYAAQIGLIYLKIDNQIMRPEMSAVGVPAVIKSGESILISVDFTNEFFIDQFIVGDYMAVANVDFSLDEELTEHMYMEVEIPITITK